VPMKTEEDFGSLCQVTSASDDVCIVLPYGEEALGAV